MIEDASEEGALGSRICALRGRLGSEVLVLVLFGEEAAAAAAGELVLTGFKSAPVKRFEARDTLGGKLGGMGVESKEESLLECCLEVVSSSSAPNPETKDFTEGGMGGPSRLF